PPDLVLWFRPYDPPPTSTGTNRASYLLRSRLPRSHTFSASFSRRSGLAYEQQIPRSIRTVQSLRFYLWRLWRAIGTKRSMNWEIGLLTFPNGCDSSARYCQPGQLTDSG